MPKSLIGGSRDYPIKILLPNEGLCPGLSDTPPALDREFN